MGFGILRLLTKRLCVMRYGFIGFSLDREPVSQGNAGEGIIQDTYFVRPYRAAVFPMRQLYACSPYASDHNEGCCAEQYKPVRPHDLDGCERDNKKQTDQWYVRIPVRHGLLSDLNYSD